jgi:hypothetical protein
MAGQLTIDTLRAGSGVLATQNGMTGIAKAWVAFNAGAGGTTAGTIVNSFNVSSVTANSTGNFTLNYTTAMPNGNYTIAGMALENNNDTSLSSNRFVSLIRTPPTTTSVRIGVTYPGNDTFQTAYSVFVTVFGN